MRKLFYFLQSRSFSRALDEQFIFFPPHNILVVRLGEKRVNTTERKKKSKKCNHWGKFHICTTTMFYEMKGEGVKNAMSINMGDNKSEYETFTLTHCWRMRMKKRGWRIWWTRKISSLFICLNLSALYVVHGDLRNFLKEIWYEIPIKFCRSQESKIL